MPPDCNCPHCGKPIILDIKKATLDKVAAVDSAAKDIKTGIVDAVVRAVEKKAKDNAPISLLEFSKRTALRHFGDSEDDSIAGAWLSSAKHVLRAREEMKNNNQVEESQEDSDKVQLAMRLQKAVLQSLAGEKEK